MRILYLLPAAILAAPRLPNFNPEEESPNPGFELASKNLLASMNLSVDPCTDFFEFSCGNWIANNPIPGYLTSYGSFHVLREKVQAEMKVLYETREVSSSKAINQLRGYYRSCMDQDAIDRVGPREALNEIALMNYWPMIHGSKWEARRFDLTDLLIKMGNARGMDVFIDASAGVDIKNVTRRILQFDQGNLGLGSGTRDYFLDKKKFAKQMNAYRNLLIQRAVQLTLDSALPVNETQIAADVDEVLEFETRFAEITVPEDERRNFSELYHVRKFDDLNEMMPLIDWKKYFLSVMPFSIHSYINSNPDIVFAEPAFYDRLTGLLNSTDPRIITNYMMFRFVANYGLELGNKYEEIVQNFAREMYGRKERAPRWKDCITDANSKMSYAAGAMYVRAHFDSKSKDTTLAMIVDLQTEFNKMLMENDWMDENTKKVGLEKAEQMQKLIGYPDFILNDAKLDEWYKELNTEDSDSYGKMNAKMIRFYTDFYYKRLLETVDREEFAANAATVNAFYSSIKNAIMFPAAILQIPFFHHSYPKALNYGGIGSVIGHEITHGFDDQGRQFDAIGNLREWWDQSTSEKYTERAKCIVDQYANVSIPEIGLNINGILTQGENIADNGGVKEAFRAYKQYLARNGEEKRIPGLEQFDNEQMFFIGYSQNYCGHMTPESKIRQILTDPHSPGRYRVNVVLQNQPEFASAFKCPFDSPMNPAQRCSVW